MSNKKSLGRGLSALLNNDAKQVINSTGVVSIPINNIKANPYQPRKGFNETKLLELAKSIRKYGILQPLIVRIIEDDKYELIVGERRLRAAKLAGLETVPAVVKDVTNKEMLELAVIENVQREDLTVIEEATAYKQLVEEFNIPIAKLSKKLGRSIPYVSNKIRLLELPDVVLDALQNDIITEGHARALIGLKSRELILAALDIIINKDLSVRLSERLVARMKERKAPPKKTDYVLPQSAIKIQEDLAKYFRSNVSIIPTKKGGKLVIKYRSPGELEVIYKKIVEKGI